jgi:hypothetical protein
MRTLLFYLRYTWFNIQEQFSDLPAVFAESLLVPFFIWVVVELWRYFNASQGHYTIQEVALYVAVTETLYLTFLRTSSFSRASADFSISLARPRSWLLMSFTGIFGRCLGLRLIYLGIMVLIMPFFLIPWELCFPVWLRLLSLLPILGLFQALMGMLFACFQVLWQEVHYFVMPVGKIFLSLGGVFGPIIDFKEPFRSVLLKFPPSDVFFQPAHYCLKGEFYQISPQDWILKMLLTCLFLAALNCVLFSWGKRYHQAYGG